MLTGGRPDVIGDEGDGAHDRFSMVTTKAACRVIPANGTRSAARTERRSQLRTRAPTCFANSHARVTLFLPGTKAQPSFAPKPPRPERDG